MHRYFGSHPSSGKQRLSIPAIALMLCTPASAVRGLEDQAGPIGWGEAVAWGDNASTQCVVRVLPSNSGVTQVAAGASHGVALLSGGTVQAWGGNASGQCNVPGDLGVVVQIAAGGSHTVALLRGGTMRAWGGNASV